MRMLSLDGISVTVADSGLATSLLTEGARVFRLKK